MRAAVSRFWQLDTPPTARGRADQDLKQVTGQISCPVNPDQDNLLIMSGELSVLLTSKRITDFVWTWYHELLIQDRVVGMFREQGFTGFDTRPVKVRMKVRAKEPDPCDDAPGVSARAAARAQIPTFWQLVPTGWGGVAPPESGVRLIKRCPGCNRQWYSPWTDASRLIDARQWDGSDFFVIWPLYGFYVTDRVAQFIMKNKLSPAKLVPLEQMKWPEHVPDLAPGRLRDWFPEDRARALGEPLGIY